MLGDEAKIPVYQGLNDLRFLHWTGKLESYAATSLRICI